MLPGTDDDVFWEGFSAVVPRLMEAFKPDVVVSQLGVDTFQDDPLAALELTTNGFCKTIDYLTKEGPAWVALGGGGYNPPGVARAWTMAWAIMNGVDLPDDLPQGMTSPLSAGDSHSQRLGDREHKSPWHDQCLDHMRRSITHLETHVFPKIA
jgi:acetoin utilization protein AcuC